MYKNTLALLLLSFAITSCNPQKKYHYVETVEAPQLLGGTDIEQEDTVEIKALTDSAAYMQAFQKFCISQKVSMDMKKSFGSAPSTPLRFSLYNDKGEDIALSVTFNNKPALEEEMSSHILSMANNFEENKKEEALKMDTIGRTLAPVDSAKLLALLKNFRVKSDEFSNDDKKWYEPKSAPKYTNANGIYCYFHTIHGVPGNFRFRVQYFADDWLFFKRVQFSIDGKAYEYIPMDTETDNGNGGYIWEWFDEKVASSDKELINALANAKSAKMKFIGRQYHNVKTITAAQIKSIKESLELYQAMGGEW